MAAPEARSSEASHKGRKLNRSANQLKRNAACLPCRRRRIKCDAVKPHCTSCVRNYHYLKRTQPDDERDGRGVQCNYEECDSESEGLDFARPVVGKRKEGAGSESVEPPEAVHRLEARVAELQAALHASTSGPNAAGTSSLPLSASGSGSNTPIRMPAMDAFPQPAASNDDFVPNPMISILHGMPFNMMDTTTMAYNASSFLHTTAVGGGAAGQRRPIDELADTLTAAVPPMDLPTSFAASHPDVGTSKPIIAQVVVEDIPEANAGVWQGLDEEAGKLGGPFLELIWPGWPPKLPTPAMLDHLVNVFFTSVPSIPRILHKQMFRSRLSLPPSHVHFPHPALLHAICAVAARYSAAVKIDSVAESIARYNAGFETPEDDIAAISCFAERNTRYAISEMKRAGMLKGRKFFEMLQAQQSAKWVDGWIGLGSMARSCVPLGLMHDEEPELSIFSSRRFRRGFMTPVTEDWDREERRAVMYYVICIDASFCSSSAYPGSILTEEVTAKFPGSKVEFENGGFMTPNPQTFHSPDLYTDHPVVDPLVMWIKGMVLLHRVGRFTRKIRLPGSAPISQVRFSDEFQRIDRDIQDFNRTFPPSLRDPLQAMPGTTNRIDPDLVATHLVRRVVGIILHEPFAALADMNNLSTQRLLINARACSNIVHSVFNSNMDVALMLAPLTPRTLPSSTKWLFVAVRTILMFYQHALEIGDRQSAQNLFVEVDVFLRAFEALGKRLAIGAQQHTMLNAMIDELNQRFGIVRPSPSLGPSITILDLNPPAPPAPLAQPWTTAALSNSISNMPSLSHASNASKVSSGSNVSAIANLSNNLSNANSPAMSSNSGSHGSPLDAKLLPNPNVTGLNTPFTTSSPPIPSVLRPAQLPANSVHDMAQQQPQPLQPLQQHQQQQQHQHQQHQHQQQPAPDFFWANAGSGATTFQDYSGPNLMNLGMRP
ncbi:hypothetical protein EHS25_003461 [Saitozyma podzolica]|uniref:Zn(2)-C6 fungal-type domain-containing protein n=1 Tax=Saitozyma podzolica TaxID=1890683 RepID=A0A427Y7A2_9TREE|nr:hypothetical protein EHS25_003461 [Saitozyma podzolica]